MNPLVSPVPSKPGSGSESRELPRIPAGQGVTSPGRGGLSDHFSRRKSGHSETSCSHKRPLLALISNLGGPPDGTQQNVRKRAEDPVVSLSHQSPNPALNRLSRPLSVPDGKWFLENRGSKRPTLASHESSPRTLAKVVTTTLSTFRRG